VGVSRKRLIVGINASLKRLQMDSVDVLYAQDMIMILHWQKLAEL